MIAYNSYIANGFVYMPMYVGPYEHGHPLLNANDGYYAQSLLVVHGSGDYHVRDTEDGAETSTALPAPGSFHDVSANYEKYHCLEAGSNGLAVVFFNPLPITNTLAFEKLTAGTHTVNNSSEANKYVVCVNGPITIGDKNVVAHRYGTVHPGETYTVTVPTNSLAVVVTVS